MKKKHLFAAAIILLSGCGDRSNEKVTLKIYEKDGFININILNNSGRYLCIPSEYFTPSAVADPPEGLSEGVMLWRSQQRALVYGDREARRGDIPEYRIINEAGNEKILLDPERYSSGDYSIIIEGSFCDDILSKKSNVKSFIIFHKFSISSH